MYEGKEGSTCRCVPEGAERNRVSLFLGRLLICHANTLRSRLVVLANK